MTLLAGCELTSIDPAALIAGGRPIADSASGYQWFVGYYLDGVVWGRIDAGRWVLASEALPNSCGTPNHDGLMQARLFGPNTEAYVWRDADTHELRARSLTDSAEPSVHTLRPADAALLVLGDRVVDGRDGFTLMAEANGRRVVVPLEVDPSLAPGRHWPVRVNVRRYFTQLDSGAVRVAASRLVNIWTERPKERR